MEYEDLHESDKERLLKLRIQREKRMDDELQQACLQKQLDHIAYEQQKELLVALAIHFNPATRFMRVPPNTKYWRVVSYTPEHISVAPATSLPPLTWLKPDASYWTVELIPFFGMFVGYLVVTDTIYLWERP